MSIGQAGKRAQQFSNQRQRRHTLQYNGGSTEPLIQRTPIRRVTNQSPIAPVPPSVVSKSVLQRDTDADAEVNEDTEVEEASGTSAVQNPTRGQNNSSHSGRSSESANVGGEDKKELNPEVIADKVYEIMLRENRDFIDRIGKRLKNI